MQRMTDRHLKAKADTINRLLGFDPETISWNTIGAIRIGSAYGGTSVEMVMNEHGGVEQLQGYGTKREAATFLSGMTFALRISTETRQTSCSVCDTDVEGIRTENKWMDRGGNYGDAFHRHMGRV